MVIEADRFAFFHNAVFVKCVVARVSGGRHVDFSGLKSRADFGRAFIPDNITIFDAEQFLSNVSTYGTN
jgi:hypothetical protein